MIDGGGKLVEPGMAGRCRHASHAGVPTTRGREEAGVP